jgi:hypothetical protein
LERGAANPSAKLMLEVMERKRSNLCVAVDVTTTAELIKLADAVGPYICLLKESGGRTLGSKIGSLPAPLTFTPCGHGAHCSECPLSSLC